MKTKIFLAMGLMASVYGYGQTYAAPTGGVNPAGTGGTDCVHLGHSAGAVTTAGALHNVFVGYEAGILNTIGNSNTFIGYRAGQSNTTAGGSVFVGSYAGMSHTAGASVMVGNNAGQNNNGDRNVFVGTYCGTNNATGIENSFYGAFSGRDSSGSYNTFIGRNSGRNIGGNDNVCLGYNAGRGIDGVSAPGNRNVLIGYAAGRSMLGDDKLFIANSDTPDPLIYGDFNAGFLRLNGLVGIGGPFGLTDFPSLAGDFANYKLFVKGNILAEEVRIRTFGTWPDYVFFKDYNLLSLKEIEKFIAENGHLPNMPSAAEVKEQGLEMGNIIKLQQEKIEELTLHLIRQEKELEALKENNKQLVELKIQVEALLKKQ